MADSILKLKKQITGLKQQLEETTERFNNITDTSLTGIYIINDSFRIVYANRRLCEISGYTNAELTNMDFTDILDDDSREQVIENYQRRQKNLPAPTQYEFNIIRKDGEKRRVQISPTVMHNSKNEVFSIGHIMDITSNWQTLRMKSAMFKISEAANQTNDLSDLYHSIHSTMGTILDVTNFYIALYDEDNNIINFPYYIDEIDNPPDPQNFGKGLTEYIIRTGEPLFITENGIHDLAKAGKIDLLGTPSKLWMGSPLKIDNRIIGVVVVQSYSSDSLYSRKDLNVLNYVSEQIATSIRNKMSEEALLIEKTHLEELFQSSPEAIVLVERNGTIQRVNPEFTAIFGYSASEVIGQNIDELITESWQKDEANSITKQVADGEKIRFDTVRFRKDGSPVYVSILSAPVFREGEKQAVYAIYRDITERKLWEEKIRSSEGKYRRLSDRLSETNDLKDLLLDVITHDLKNPAGVISGMAEVLIDESSNYEGLDVIKESSDNLLKVIDNAATLSKITVGDEIQKEEIELTQLLSTISSEFSSQMSSMDINLEVNLDNELLIHANPIIAEVFRNYINNAIKYAADGKRIIIDSHCDPTSITIRIKDQGATIPEKNRRSIFKRSFQINNTEKHGRGLGLAIVERIATVHDASVWVEPNHPNGNSFCIKIPRS